MSFGLEGLLVAMSVFLVVGAHRLQQLAHQKMRFVAGVSHELRTPVSAISMLSKNQADGLVTAPERIVQYGELIHQQSQRLNEMVEETLQYAGIQSGLRPQAREEVDLKTLIEESVRARHEEFTRNGIEIETNIPSDLPLIHGDAKLLRIAFDNLLSNAYRHAAIGRWIRINARYSRTAKEVQVMVEDRGPGIDSTEQAEVFEAFWRGRVASEMQIPGSGLGLSLVKGAAEAHGGTVTLISQLGRGSAFTLHLPV
jgi:signal transduction histidine kinase